MTILLRFLGENRSLWRIWLPILCLAILAPVISIMVPLVERRLIDDVVLPQRVDRLPKMAALYASLWIVSTIVVIAAGVLRSYLGERMNVELRQRLFNHTEKLSIAFSRTEHSGRTTSLFVTDVPSLTGLFSTTIVGGVGSLVAIVVGGVVMYRLNPTLALVGALGPLAAAGGAAVITRPLRPAARRAQEKAAELNQRLQEHLGGIREIVAFGREESQAERFGTTLRELLRLRMRVTAIEMGIGTGASIFSLVVTLTIFIYGSYLVINGQTSLGTVIAMRSLFGLLFQPAGQLIGLFTSSQKALAAADRIYAFLDEKPMVEDFGEIVPENVLGTIVFDGVDFSYRHDEQVLHGISFTAKGGDLIALVGPSGAGKSTIAGLIARFYDPDRGRILLDGTDIRAIPLASLRESIGFVFQDTYLFGDTIRENILFGRLDATEQEIIDAAQSAHAWEFIEKLPHALDTQVGERGVQLSEGQKQRIAIARAMLRNPRILVLDEPTSALDARSERYLQAAFDNLMEGRTTFVIAHRLATVQRADHILVIDNGYLIERGTHLELLDRDGLYRELFVLQFGDVSEIDIPSTSGVLPLAAVGD